MRISIEITTGRPKSDDGWTSTLIAFLPMLAGLFTRDSSPVPCNCAGARPFEPPLDWAADAAAFAERAARHAPPPPPKVG